MLPALIAASIVPTAVVVFAVSSSFVDTPSTPPTTTSSAVSPSPSPSKPVGTPRRGDAALTAADGILPDGATVFDDQYPGIAGLDPAFLRALREAANDAERDGVTFAVNSAWRSPAYQNELLRQGIATHGSAAEAAKWVSTPDVSHHVTGHAIDMDGNAKAWLSEHGSRYGLCQTYRNEPWHFELRPDAADGRCPPMYADASHDTEPG